MWLHVPSTSCPSAPVWEALNSAFTWRSEAGPGLWVTSSGKPTQRPLSWRAWKTRAWIKRLYGTISSPLTAQRGVDAWTSSLRASRASRGAPPGSEAAQTTPSGSGLLSYGSLWTWTPDTCSWRTCQASLPGMDLNTCCPDLPKRGSMRSGVISARLTLAPPTGGGGCSFWPTADANTSSYSNGRIGPNLREAAKMWPTPKGRDWKGLSERGMHAPQDALPNMATIFSRPARTMPKPGEESSQRIQNWAPHYLTLEDAYQQQLKGLLRLNPLFVEWLMGWPIGWADSARAVTAWSRYKQRMRSALSRLLFQIPLDTP